MLLKKMATMLAAVMLLSLCVGCSKSDKAMPLTKENLLAYKNKMVESQNTITSQDQNEARSSQEGAARLFKKTFVQPVEEMGYDYDKTIRALGEQLVDGKVPQGDAEVRTLTEGFVLMAKSTEGFAAKNGFLSSETCQILSKVHVTAGPAAAGR